MEVAVNNGSDTSSWTARPKDSCENAELVLRTWLVLWLRPGHYTSVFPLHFWPVSRVLHCASLSRMRRKPKKTAGAACQKPETAAWGRWHDCQTSIQPPPVSLPTQSARQPWHLTYLLSNLVWILQWSSIPAQLEAADRSNNTSVDIWSSARWRCLNSAIFAPKLGTRNFLQSNR